METQPDASSSSAVVDIGLEDCAREAKEGVSFAGGRTLYPLALPCVSVYALLAAIKTGLRRLPARATEMLRTLCGMSSRGALGWGTGWQ
jgi:hypothetical protein